MDIKKAIRKSYRGEIIRRVILVGQSLIEVIIAVKSKQIIYLGHSVASLYNAIESFRSINAKSIDKFLIDLGLKKIYSGLEKSIHKMLLSLNYHQQELSISTMNPEYGPSTEDTILMFEVEDVSVYFHSNGGFICGLYVEDAEKFRKVLSTKLLTQFGKYIIFNIIDDKSWPLSLTLRSTEMPVNIYYSTIDEKEYYDNVIKIRKFGLGRASLFYGPPGSGKTLFSARISDMLGSRLLVIGPDVLNCIRSNNISIIDVFELLSPGVVLFDDIDRVNEETLGLLLGFFEYINKNSKEILIIGTVNNLNLLPDALKRPGRFDEIISFDPPNIEARKKILKLYLDHFGTRLANKYIAEMAELTEGLTPAYLKEIALKATILPYNRISEVISQMRSMFCIRNRDMIEENMVEIYETKM